MKKTCFLFLFFISISISAQNPYKGFVYLHTIDATIQQELRYFTSNNFIGKPVDGYKKEVVIVSYKAAIALKNIQKKILKDSLSLKIFDGYRPQQAVNHFVKWARVLNDTLMKQQYYPKVSKSKLFKLGFIASKSGHTRGSSIDLTIVNLKTNNELDMGSPYDFFGNESHPFYKKVNKNQHKNRMLLRKIMIENGFKPYNNEWWHFTLRKEPFPKTYFNFPIE